MADGKRFGQRKWRTTINATSPTDTADRAGPGGSNAWRTTINVTSPTDTANRAGPGGGNGRRNPADATRRSGWRPY